MSLFLKSLVIGLSVAVPVGPIGLLCIQRTLEKGRVYGFLSGAGAATADATYAGIAGFGVAVISGFLIDQRIWIRLLGGMFLLILGVRKLVGSGVDVDSADEKGSGSLWLSYSSTFLLTMANPTTILFFVAIFAALGGIASQGGDFGVLVMVFGVFLGSALWWFVLSSFVHMIRRRLGLKAVMILSKISALIIVAFGLYGILSVAVAALR